MTNRSCDGRRDHEGGPELWTDAMVMWPPHLMMVATRLLPKLARSPARLFGLWLTDGLARCARLPRFAHPKLREKSCTDVYDSTHCRRCRVGDLR